MKIEDNMELQFMMNFIAFSYRQINENNEEL